MGVIKSKSSSQPNQPVNPNRKTTESRFVLITGMGYNDNINTLKEHLEFAIDPQNSVEKIVFGSSSDKVVSIFRHPVKHIGGVRLQIYCKAVTSCNIIRL
ncbi:hypothetical protein CHS0354_037268 [Potamilus streckersoni]|uniref:Uncharacterized protein n=1 Tax=Potamilus streckersoni TaxID=2493646 RepID=A0AAE0SX20_9BIVA|nr:hypothetical protein CHS0354_037268 [Potamilus streckersoni]